MNKTFQTVFVFFLLLCSFMTCAKVTVVANQAELKDAIKYAKAGDDIVLQNGTYKNIEIEFFGEGTKNKPITLRAQTPGQVFIEGLSNIEIGGKFLIVKGLHFRNGYTPSRTVVKFKIDDNNIAFHSTFTNNVIEEFTQLDREVSDRWIELWGQHNQVSHNYIAGKSNFGPTVMVELKGNQHVNNYHQIVRNHFGSRPRKGGPHGETMQIGNSSTSMTPSYTNVANNFFDRCNGEVEIISSKSNFNTFKNNVFFESEGSLVLRHGNYAKIDGNVFIGDGKSAFYGGIRVINTGHWITNNYFYKLKGEKFRAPISVMNGIPKAPLNRYNQVTDVVVAYNSWMESPVPWYFSVGNNIDQQDVLPKSEIRSARPIRTIFANNLIFNSEKAEYPIYNYDKVDGVIFENNITNHLNKSPVISQGIVTQTFSVSKVSDYLLVPKLNYNDVYVGFDFDKIDLDLFGIKRPAKSNVGAMLLPLTSQSELIDKAKYGTSWFETEKTKPAASVYQVSTSAELVKAIKQAKSGDLITLSAAEYSLSEAIVIDKEISIVSANKTRKSLLNFSSPYSAFTMLPKGVLRLDSVIISGNKTQHAFATLRKNMSKAYNLYIDNSEIRNVDSVLEVSKGSFADTISILNSTIENTNSGLNLNKEKNDKGDYNSEFVIIKGSKFNNVSGTIVDYYRGGYDESTIGGNLVFENNTVTNSGKLESDGILIKNRGIINVDLKNNSFSNNPVKVIAILWGEKGQKPMGNKITNSGEVKIVQNLQLKLMY